MFSTFVCVFCVDGLLVGETCFLKFPFHILNGMEMCNKSRLFVRGQLNASGLTCFTIQQEKGAIYILFMPVIINSKNTWLSITLLYPNMIMNNEASGPRNVLRIRNLAHKEPRPTTAPHSHAI